MCILLASCAHPDYSLILLSNRDEFFERPTDPASFHDLTRSVLTPTDLARPEGGTWIGVARSGRLAVLVNFKEEDLLSDVTSRVSRGLLPLSWLKSPRDPDEWEKLTRSTSNNFENIGGFSLLYGEISPGKLGPFRVLSNRHSTTQEVFKQKKTFGLSNSLLDNPWPKVTQGESLLSELVEKSMESKWTQDQIIERGFEVLSTNNIGEGEFSADEYGPRLRETIFVPPLKTKWFGKLEELHDQFNYTVGGYYGTRNQTVILVDKQGNVTYVEKTLHSSDDLREKPQTHVFGFKIQ